MSANSVRLRLLATVPHLHFPLGFAHLGNEQKAHWFTVRFNDGVAHDMHSEQLAPTMRAMIAGAARRAVSVWHEREKRRELAMRHPGLRSLPPEDLEAVLSHGMSDG